MNTQVAQNPVVSVGNVSFGNRLPFVLIAGPCQMESREHALEMASALNEITDRLHIPFVFKASFDKANRTSGSAARGIGLAKAMEVFAEIKSKLGLPVITDVHDAAQCAPVAEVVDILQIPAFLCRQTDLLLAAAATGRAINVKKGQFLAPHDMLQVVAKARLAAQKAGVPEDIMVCERGVSFGYNNLVSDMRALAIMRETQCPVVFDATHSVQLPGGQGTSSGGQREFVPVLARAAVAAGVSGLFMETHPNPAQALSDGPNAVPLDQMKDLLTTLLDLDRVVKRHGFLESRFA